MINDETISKIRVIFNEPFKLFIKNLKRNVDISELFLQELERVMPKQKEIREYIERHQSEFDMECGTISTNKFESHPDFFAIMICIIIPDLESYSNFQEVLDSSNKGKWSISLYSSNNSESGLDDYASNYFKCACNHCCSPENLFIINNITTNQNILIGNHCAQKTGFIEPEKIKTMMNNRENDPKYARFISDAKKKNEIIYIQKMTEGLDQCGESIENVKQTYTYYGGNYGEHIESFMKKKSDSTIDDLIVEKCDACGEKTKKKLFIIDDSETSVLCVCPTCCKTLEKLPEKTQGTCEDCGAKHRNRSDNYCDTCRNKKWCINCSNREFCDMHTHCSACNSKYLFCSGCHIEKVYRKGYKCTICFQKMKKCACGLIISNPKYKKCFNCK